MGKQGEPSKLLLAIIGLLFVALLLGGGLIARGVQRQPENTTIRATATAVTAAGVIDQTPAPTPTAVLSASPTPAPTPTTVPAIRDAAPRPAAVAAVPNVRVSTDSFTAHSEVALAQNPRDPQNLVGASKMFTDNQNYIFRIGTYASTDGGKTWIDNGHLPGLDQFGLTSDPSIVFDSDGTAYVEVLAARGPDNHSALYLYKSSDGGNTWSEPLLVSDSTSGFNDKEWLASDTTGGRHDGALYTTWVQIAQETYRILFARSIDGGKTWSEPRTLAADNKVARQAPVVTVGAAGAVYVQWSNLTNNHFETIASTDGGETFDSVREGAAFQQVYPLKGNLRRGFVLGAFAADPREAGTLYSVWDDGRRGDSDVLFSVSRDGGATWAEPVIVNGATVNDQFQPWLALDKAGEIYVQWFDRRDDPANLRVQTYGARSTDGGQTWSELRVTDVASDPTLGLPRVGKSGFYGDYQALVADQTGAHFFWNETRDGSQQIYTADVPDDRWQLKYHVRQAGPVQPDAPPPQQAGENEDGD